jgi:hypothetical protein
MYKFINIISKMRDPTIKINAYKSFSSSLAKILEKLRTSTKET